MLDGSESCFEKVTVQQKGTNLYHSWSHFIIPCANFTCHGRITSVIASMSMVRKNGTDPFIEVWHPTTTDMNVLDKIGEVQLVENKVVEEVDNDSNSYWLVNITLNDDDRIEFEAGDVIGYYHPPDTRFLVWNIPSLGYQIIANNFGNGSKAIKFGKDVSLNNLQSLIQVTIGMSSLLNYINVYMCCVFVDIRCDILSTPSNGKMSCSSGKMGVGYEGDTCRFTCNTGYELLGNGTSTCQSNESWSFSNSTCKKGR